MKTVKFMVRLQSDIIINQKAANEGPNKTLDFIPGSNFLGIAASSLYKKMDEETWYIFHSGHVRFGDAHMGTGGVRSHKVPAAMFHPKLEKTSEKLYIWHLIPKDEVTQQVIRYAQLKQCRSGFFDFTQNPARPIIAGTAFAIKSAHDIVTRTSKNRRMYGYESLSKGNILYFEVEVDNEKYATQLTKALVGTKRLGRSRSAQYGLVEISEVSYTETASRPASGGIATVYADSRLVFIDEETGLPTFRPKAKDLGLECGQIDWENSQIRTFQYAPWNYQRQCFDTDRCGIEKGSVIVVKDAVGCPSASQYVGCYKNEGFGRVIYNPDFLDGDKASGIAAIKLAEPAKEKVPEPKVLPIDSNDSDLMRFLKTRYNEESDESNILKNVNKWVEDNKARFKGKEFASQWGTIRRLAAKAINSASLKEKLFKEETGYLKHGVAEGKWAECGGFDALKAFADKFVDDQLLKAIVNLAAEMAKECGKEDEE